MNVSSDSHGNTYFVSRCRDLQLFSCLVFTGINKLVEDGYCHGKSTLIISQYFQNVKVVPQPIVRNLEEYLSKKFDSRLNPETVVQSVL